jgi:DNA-binding MarR family transcriptional regulator
MEENDVEIIDLIVENIVAVMPIFHRKILNVLDDGMSSGLSHYHFAILGILSKWDALPISELCRKLLISKSQMTMMLDKLVEQGLVTRSPDESDRRMIRILITSKGKSALNRALENIRASIAQKIDRLEKGDVELFAASLGNIIKISSKLD